jgi:hypothetical protein
MILREAGGALRERDLPPAAEGGFSFTGNNPTISIAVRSIATAAFAKLLPGLLTW